MMYKANWEETQKKFSRWWKHKNQGRPLMSIVVKKATADDPLPENLLYTDVNKKYRDANLLVDRYRYYCEQREFWAESFPNLSVDFGPGSVAGYLGANIVFAEDTVWFEECTADFTQLKPFTFSADNPWWQEHLALVKKCRELVGDDFYIGIPDLMENVDVLASLRGAQDLIYDMIDEPEEIKARISQIDDLYFSYYDPFFQLTKDRQGGSCYTVFQVWGPGRMAKLQCDFSALMSPNQFREFIQPSLRKQAQRLDQVLYHLDGPDAIKHLDAVLEIDEIDALQWTSGDYGPDGTAAEWYSIYDKARQAGKSLWIKVYSGTINDWIAGVDKLVERYGSDCLFLHFPEMSKVEAEYLLAHGEKYWSDIVGSFAG